MLCFYVCQRLWPLNKREKWLCSGWDGIRVKSWLTEQIESWSCWSFQLTDVNERMSDYMNNLKTNSHSAALLHTLQRHRDILQDYSSEFQKTKSNIMAFKEREDLLGSVRRDIEWVKSFYVKIFFDCILRNSNQSTIYIAEYIWQNELKIINSFKDSQD